MAVENSKGATNRRSHLEDNERIDFQPQTLACAAFFATMLLYSPNTSIFTGFAQGGPLMGYCIFPMFGTCLIMSVIAIILSTRERGDRSHWTPNRKVALAGAIVYMLGTMLFFAALQLQESYPVLAVVSGILIGAGIIPASTSWGYHFMRFNMKNALFHTAILCGLASLITWLLTLMPYAARLGCYPLLVVVGTFAPLFGLGSTGSGVADDTVASRTGGATLESNLVREDVAADADDRLIASTASENTGSRVGFLIANLKKFGSVTGLLFIGFVLYAFMMSIHKYNLFGIVDGEVFAGMIAAVCIIPFCFIKSDKPIFDLIIMVIVPIIVAILYVLLSFPADSAFRTVGTVVIYILLTILAILAMASLAAIMHAGEFTPMFIFSVAIFCATLVSLAGIAISHFVVPETTDFGPLILVLCSAYFGAIIVSTGLSAWRSLTTAESRKPTATSVTTLKDDLEARCDSIANRCGLSRRESEIIFYMARGHNPVYIAKTLLISESTARSHVRNIYRKLGVNSREELLALIDGEKVTEKDASVA